MPMRSRTVALLALWWLSVASSAQAQPQANEVRWQSHWPKLQIVEYVATGVVGGSALAIAFGVDARSSGGYGGVLYDDAVRDALRAQSRGARDRARLIGDMGYRFLFAYPVLDALVTPWAIHGQPEVAFQMLAMDVEVFAIAGFVGIVTDHFIGRARPSVEPCRGDPDYEAFCDEPDEFGSFLSGHSAIAAAGAGLTCAHHLNLPLYGGGAPDIGACIVASALAITTGVSRIANDRHWATDVSAGLLVGGLVGYGVPVLFHYRSPAPETTAARGGLRLRALPLLMPGYVAGHVFGSF